jgi:hypothetical protein
LLIVFSSGLLERDNDFVVINKLVSLQLREQLRFLT